MRDETLPIVLRPAVADDYGYILASWTRELHKVQPYNFIPNSIFFPHYTQLINSLLAQSQVTIACLDDSPNDIAGYLIAQPHDESNLVLHWCQVKAIFRRLGVAKALLEPYEVTQKNIICSHYFNLFKQLKDKYHLIFDPTLLQEIK